MFSDLALARRLERAEGQSNADFVEARAQLFPESGARWLEVAGAYAMFDGVDSPLTQTFGLGIFEPVTTAHLELIEAFYLERASPVFHEVSPLADGSVLTLLRVGGYHPVEFTSVMFRPLSAGFQFSNPGNERIKVRLARDSDLDLWAAIAAKGWSELTEYADLMFDLAKISAQRRGGLAFLAEIENQPIATGAMSIHNGVALLAGASTIPEARKQGAQLALLDSRLRYAAEQGCDVAMMCARPGSSSQRNAERHRFRIAYTRIKWRLDEQ